MIKNAHNSLRWNFLAEFPRNFIIFRSNSGKCCALFLNKSCTRPLAVINTQMKINLIYLIIILTLLSCNGNGRFHKLAEIKSISVKYDNGQLLEAKKDLNKYLTRKPYNELAWTILGHIDSDLGNYLLSETSYKKALEINPKTVEAITGLGIISRKNNNYDKAIKYYTQAIKIDSSYGEAYSSLTAIYLKRKKFDKAVKFGLKGYNLTKDNPTSAANLAITYHYIKDTIEREKYYKIAQRNGYKNLDILRQIFNNERTIFD